VRRALAENNSRSFRLTGIAGVFKPFRSCISVRSASSHLLDAPHWRQFWRQYRTALAHEVRIRKKDAVCTGHDGDLFDQATALMAAVIAWYVPIHVAPYKPSASGHSGECEITLSIARRMAHVGVSRGISVMFSRAEVSELPQAQAAVRTFVTG
jgi:hypothetical protein